MKTISCAYKSPDYSGGLTSSDAPEGQKTKDVFPAICIEGPAAEQLTKNMSVGDEMTATVKLRATEVTNRKGARYGDDGARIELELVSISPQSVSQSTDAEAPTDDQDASSAIKDYFGKKKAGAAPMDQDGDTAEPDDDEDDYSEYD